MLEQLTSFLYPTVMTTLFSKIIHGNIPSYKLYEDEHSFAFLDINPVQKGHTLIVPKIEVDHFIDVPEPYYSAVFRTAQILGKAIHSATGCKRVGGIVLGWDVPHFHYHLIPMWQHGDLDFKKAHKLAPEVMVEIQKAIVGKIKS